MISLQGITKSFKSGGQHVTVLDKIDLEIARGELAVLQAPSGSGKSTLLNLIGCIDAADSGAVFIDGTPTTSLSDDDLAHLRNHKIGFIFQSFHLVPVLSAVENVEYPLQLMGVPSTRRRRMALDMLARVGLADQALKVPGKLSGGQRQRVAIARALVGNPAIVLADEPTANLDRKTGEDIMTLIGEMNRQGQVTFLIATHDPMVVSHCRRLLSMSEGRIYNA